MSASAPEPLSSCTIKLQPTRDALRVVRFTASGEHVLAGGDDREVHLLSPFATTFEEEEPPLLAGGGHGPGSAHYVTSLRGEHGYPISDIAITPDSGRVLSVGGDRDGFLWDTRSASCVLKFRGHALALTSACFLGPSGAVAATGSRDYSVHIWDARAKGRNVLQILGGFKDAVTCVRPAPSPTPFPPSSASSTSAATAATDWNETTLLCSCLDGSVHSYDLRKGGKTVDYTGSLPTYIAGTADGQAYAVATLPGDGEPEGGPRVRLVDRKDGSVLNTYCMGDPQGTKMECAFVSYDNYLVSPSPGGLLHIASVESGIVSTSSLWAPAPSAHSPPLPPLRPQGHARGSAVCSVAGRPPHPDTGKERCEVATAGADGAVCLWAQQSRQGEAGSG